MKWRKRTEAILLACTLMLISGCGISGHKMDIANDAPQNKGLDLKLSGYKGKMTFELTDAYVTQNLSEHGISLDKLDSYTSVYGADKNGEREDMSFSDCFSDQEKGILRENVRLYVCRIKVTNTDAVYDVKGEYDNKYTFRADNIHLCYLPDKKSGKTKEDLEYKPVDYYSLKKDGDQEWSTYELKPGESITYEVGFLVGDMIEEQKIDMEAGGLYLGNTSGDKNGEYYWIDWEER